MDTTDAYVLKVMLKSLQAVGGIGLTKAALVSQAELAAGMPLTDEQRETAFVLLRDRGYANNHLEPVTHQVRWSLTERGATALESL